MKNGVSSTGAKGGVRRIGRATAALAIGAVLVWTAACDDDSRPLVKGVDEVIDATSAAAPLPAPEYPDASSDDAAFGVYDDGAAYNSKVYAYSPLAACQQCGCEAGTFCFGGGTGHTTFSGTCAAPGGALDIGCQALPPSCAAQPTCDCVFDALRSQVPCYLVCSGTTDLTVYCPSP
jgi:hypothetical protein